MTKIPSYKYALSLQAVSRDTQYLYFTHANEAHLNFYQNKISVHEKNKTKMNNL